MNTVFRGVYKGINENCECPKNKPPPPGEFSGTEYKMPSASFCVAAQIH